MKATHSAKMTVLLVLSTLVSVSLAQTRKNTKQDNSERWQQNFLFTMKDAYLLDVGRGRVSLGMGYQQNQQLRETQAGAPKNINRDQFITSVGLEWGLLPGVQGDVTLPVGYAWQRNDTTGATLHKGDFGDMTCGLTMALQQQDSLSWTPNLAVRMGATLPLSDWNRGVGQDAWGLDGSLLASKAFDDFFWHTNITYGTLENVREFGQPSKTDKRSWLFGGALVYSPKQGYEASCELTYQTQTENRSIEVEHRHAWTITPGFNVDISRTTKFGVGIPIGAGGEAYDWGLLAKLQIEI